MLIRIRLWCIDPVNYIFYTYLNCNFKEKLKRKCKQIFSINGLVLQEKVTSLEQKLKIVFMNTECYRKKLA